jgi:acylphosphatase
VKREIVILVGRVQGVGFRAQVVRIARGFPVAGSVRNRRDGRSLEIDVEGRPEAVDAFVDAVLADPPAFGRVDRIERKAAEPRGATRFEQASTY